MEIFPARVSREMTPDDTILVIGAGLAGLSASLALARHGQSVRLIEKKKDPRLGQERSEMTLTTALEKLDAPTAATQSLTAIHFLCLDNGRNFSHQTDRSSTTTVAIDHHRLISSLVCRVKETPRISLECNRHVISVSETGPLSGVTVVLDDKETIHAKSVVVCSGPSWNGLLFPDSKTQEHFNNSLVAVAYGKRCRGRILVEDGDQAMLHPVSVCGSGLTSWVNASGPGEIEILFSTYSPRNQVGKIDRKSGFAKLTSELLKRKLIEIDEEGPTISGFFGLEPALTPPATHQIYCHGERGQYNAATVGDAIAPTANLSKSLAEVISAGGNAKEYYSRHTSKVFNHRLELALTKARARASELGLGFDMFNVVKYLKPEDQAKFLHDHKIPPHFIPLLTLRHPHLLSTFTNIGYEYLKTFIS